MCSTAACERGIRKQDLQLLERSEGNEFKRHETSAAEGQFFQKCMRLLDARNAEQEDNARAILPGVPLSDLAVEIEAYRLGDFQRQVLSWSCEGVDVNWPIARILVVGTGGNAWTAGCVISDSKGWTSGCLDFRALSNAKFRVD